MDAPREVVFLPLFLMLPGHGSFGSLKGQGLFAGVEYLENEPSSSTADLNEKAGANRRVPDSARITFPLMAIQAHDRYVGLIWDRAPELAALFDSPDRIFGERLARARADRTGGRRRPARERGPLPDRPPGSSSPAGR